MPGPNDEYDVYNPYEGETYWWMDEDEFGNPVYQGEQEFQSIVNFQPTDSAGNPITDMESGAWQHQWQNFLEDEWGMTEAGAQAVGPYLLMNPYNPTNEIGAIQEFHSNMGSLAQQAGMESYKQFSDIQNNIASRGFEYGGADYTKHIMKKGMETDWIRQAHAARGGMEMGIWDAHQEYMDSWWDIINQQEESPFDMSFFEGGVSGGVGGGAGYGDEIVEGEGTAEEEAQDQGFDDAYEDMVYDDDYDVWDQGGS